MFLLILSIALLIPAYIFWKKYKDKKDGRYMAGDAVLVWFAFPLAIAFAVCSVFLLNAIVYMNQVGDQEKITQFEENKAIYVERADDLTERLSVLLENKYPNHESEIFKNLTPQNADLVFVMYPQLRAIEGFTKLADEIKDLRNAIYRQDVLIEDKERRIRTRNRNIFYLTWLLPQ